MKFETGNKLNEEMSNTRIITEARMHQREEYDDQNPLNFQVYLLVLRPSPSLPLLMITRTIC